jgi:hypothetical protein
MKRGRSRPGHRATHGPYRRPNIPTTAQRQSGPAADDAGTCGVCGKRGFRSRAAARRAARRLFPGTHLREYECQGGTGRWHLGPAPKPEAA